MAPRMLSRAAGVGEDLGARARQELAPFRSWQSAAAVVAALEGVGYSQSSMGLT